MTLPINRMACDVPEQRPKRNRQLVVGCWFLVVSCWLLVCWFVDPGPSWPREHDKATRRFRQEFPTKGSEGSGRGQVQHLNRDAEEAGRPHFLDVDGLFLIGADEFGLIDGAIRSGSEADGRPGRLQGGPEAYFVGHSAAGLKLQTQS